MDLDASILEVILKNYRNILVIRHSGIGDILFTLPAVNLLRDNFPASNITYLTKKRFAVLPPCFKAVDRVISLDMDVYHQKNILKTAKYTLTLIKELRDQSFDLAVDFHGLGETSIAAWLTGSKDRWGIHRKKICPLVQTISLKTNSQIHLIDLNRRLLEKAGLTLFPLKNNFILPDSEIAAGRKLFAEWGYSDAKTTIFIQPFTNASRKNWPLEYFFEYALYWQERGLQIIFGGGPADRPRLEKISGCFPVAAGGAGLLTTGALMRLSTLIIGGDTGMLHLGVALGKKVLMLIGPGKFPNFHPYGHPDWAVTPKSSALIKDISLNEVIEKTETLLTEAL